MTSIEEKALRDFLLDINCLQSLNKWKEDFNLFSVLKISNMEIRHSNILAWLLDPNENHGLGDAFMHAFVTRVVAHYNLSKVGVINILLQDFYSYQVLRESNRMDIVLYSHDEKTAIIIENKIWAGESPTQLKDYLEKSKTVYRDCEQLLYVFLSPEGRASSDPNTWVALSYSEVVDSLVEATKEVQIRSDVQFLINNYIDVVRREIMKQRDEELEKVCNEIFNKHRVALRLLFENITVDPSVESAIINGALQELQDDGKIVHSKGNSWIFSTPAMNEYLPELDQPNGSWSTTETYRYWFDSIEKKKDGDYLVLHLELGGWGIGEEIKEREKALVSVAKGKTEITRYNRLPLRRTKLEKGDFQASLAAAVKKLVEEALEEEEKLLKKAKRITDKANTQESQVKGDD